MFTIPWKKLLCWILHFSVPSFQDSLIFEIFGNKGHSVAVCDSMKKVYYMEIDFLAQKQKWVYHLWNIDAYVDMRFQKIQDNSICEHMVS